MQSERRHELETNTLAKGLVDWGDKLRPYSNLILMAIAALLLVYAGASLWSSHQASRERAAWDAYELAVLESDGEQRGLQRLTSSEEHQGAQMQEWALLGWVDRQLLRASQMYLTNRDEAMKKLTGIEGIYDQYADGGSSPEIRNRARLGLARAYEMKGKVDDARKEYAKVEGGLAAVAAERMKELESKPVQETVAWLATAPLPKPALPGGPGVPGKRPGFGASSPAADPTKSGDAAVQDALKAILGGDKQEGEVAAPGAGQPAAKEKTEEKPTAPTGSEAVAPPVATPASAALAEKPAEAPAAAPTTPAAK